MRYFIQALGPPSPLAEAYGINGVSQNVGVAGFAYPSDGSVGIAGVVWDGGFPVVSLSPDSGSILYSVNDSGDAVGFRGFNAPTEVPILVRGGVSSDHDDLFGPGSLFTGINNAGLVCGYNLNTYRAFIYDSVRNAKVASIDPLSGRSAIAAATINQAGQVAGTSWNNGPRHGFVFSNGAYTDLGPAEYVEGLNDVGQVAGALGKPSPQDSASAVWDITKTPPAVQELPVPQGFLGGGGYGNGINNHGVVVGTCWGPPNSNMLPSAYIFDGSSSTDLNTLISDPGWRLQYAAAINDSGQITGNGTLNGQDVAFLLTPQPPRPSGPPPPGLLPLWELVATLIFGGVTVDAGGFVVVGGHRIPVGPWGEAWVQLPSDKRDALIGLALDEVAKYTSDANVRESIRATILRGVRTSVEQLLANAAAGAPQRAGLISRSVRPLRRGKTAAQLLRAGIRSEPPRGPERGLS